jgi:hypothetical protein
MAGTEHLAWWKSGRCDSGACVEVAICDDHVFVRDSADPDGLRLSFSRAQWLDFLQWLKHKESDAS